MATLPACIFALASALLARRSLGDLSARVAQKRRASADTEQRFSLLSPDPRLLAWDNTVHWDGITSLHGWLKVPLSHELSAASDSATPHICLRVSAHARSDSPPNGPLLTHCGGPGSGRDCPLVVMDSMSVMDDFVLLGIDQRGVPLSPDIPKTADIWEQIQDVFWLLVGGDQGLPAGCSFTESNGDAVASFPAMRCDAIYERLQGLSYDEQAAGLRRMLADLHGDDAPAPSEEDMDVIFAILASGDLPTDGAHGVSYMNETYVRWFYRLVSLEQNLCVGSPRFQRASPDGRSFNALSFAGTGELAKDIDVFRRAIGSDTMSLAGFSYGTLVAPTYATLFPEHVGRMVVDGVLPPERDLLSYLTPYNKGFFSVWQGIMTDCSSSVYRGASEDRRCPLAPGPSSKVLHMIHDKSNLTRAAVISRMFQFAITAIPIAPLAVDYASRAYAGEPAPEWCSQIPALCQAPAAPPRREPIGRAETGDRFVGGESLTMIAGVLSLDVAGRMSEEALIAWWRDSLATFPFGTARGIALGAAMASWPLYSKPLPPPGGAGMKALVIGNLHDAQTDYVGAQRMRAAYPDGALMTWQGYGHCLVGAKLLPHSDKQSQQQNEIALRRCRGQAARYLSSGELPTDGHICELEEPLGLGRAAVDVDVVRKMFGAGL